MLQLFVQEWFHLIDYCNNRDTFNADVFSSYHDNYMKAWKKLSQKQQGELTHLIKEVM